MTINTPVELQSSKIECKLQLYEPFLLIQSLYSFDLTCSSLPFNPGCSVMTGLVTAKNAVPPDLLEN